MPHSFLAEMKNSAQPFGLKKQQTIQSLIDTHFERLMILKTAICIYNNYFNCSYFETVSFSLHLKMKSLNSYNSFPPPSHWVSMATCPEELVHCDISLFNGAPNVNYHTCNFLYVYAFIQSPLDYVRHIR